MDGGSARTLCDLRGRHLWGVVESRRQHDCVCQLQRWPVLGSRSGGSATLYGESGGRRRRRRRLFPTILPDGRHFVYLSMPSNVAWLGSLDSREPPVRLLNADSQVAVRRTRISRIRQARDADGAALRRATRSLTGEAAPIAEGVCYRGTRLRSGIRTSLNGVLVYRSDPLKRRHPIDVGRSHGTPARASLENLALSKSRNVSRRQPAWSWKCSTHSRAPPRTCGGWRSRAA